MNSAKSLIKKVASGESPKRAISESTVNEDYKSSLGDIDELLASTRSKLASLIRNNPVSSTELTKLAKDFNKHLNDASMVLQDIEYEYDQDSDDKD